LSVHVESLKNWERGVGVPSLRQIPQIIEFLWFEPEPEPETLPERLAYTSRRLGLTQDDLARIIDAEPGTILCWERGTGIPAAIKGLLKNECAKLPPAFCRPARRERGAYPQRSATSEQRS
jgi:DNA-binding transcriptional regulator YiaG